MLPSLSSWKNGTLLLLLTFIITNTDMSMSTKYKCHIMCSKSYQIYQQFKVLARPIWKGHVIEHYLANPTDPSLSNSPGSAKLHTKMSRIYRVLVTSADKFVPSKLRPLWEHEAGMCTLFCVLDLEHYFFSLLMCKSYF